MNRKGKETEYYNTVAQRLVGIMNLNSMGFSIHFNLHSPHSAVPDTTPNASLCPSSELWRSHCPTIFSTTKFSVKNDQKVHPLVVLHKWAQDSQESISTTDVNGFPLWWTFFSPHVMFFGGRVVVTVVGVVGVTSKIYEITYNNKVKIPDHKRKLLVVGWGLQMVFLSNFIKI